MTNNNSKLIKTCSTTRRVVKAIRIFSYVALGVLVFVLVAMAIPGFIDMEQMTVEHSMTGTEILWGKGEVISMMAYGAVMLVILSLIMLLCERVLSTVTEDGSPFVEENVSRIKSIAILTAVSGVVPAFVSQIVRGVFALVNKTSDDLMVEVELGIVLVALVIWCVALIFEYGVTLQQRDDETL